MLIIHSPSSGHQGKRQRHLDTRCPLPDEGVHRKQLLKAVATIGNHLNVASPNQVLALTNKAAIASVKKTKWRLPSMNDLIGTKETIRNMVHVQLKLWSSWICGAILLLLAVAVPL